MLVNVLYFFPETTQQSAGEWIATGQKFGAAQIIRVYAVG
jgi:hypothetical protein